MGNEKTEGDRPDEAEIPTNERPQVPLHDPFARFEFEPTDGGDF